MRSISLLSAIAFCGLFLGNIASAGEPRTFINRNDIGILDTIQSLHCNGPFRTGSGAVELNLGLEGEGSFTAKDRTINFIIWAAQKIEDTYILRGPRTNADGSFAPGEDVMITVPTTNGKSAWIDKVESNPDPKKPQTSYDNYVYDAEAEPEFNTKCEISVFGSDGKPVTYKNY